jgi:hypothetical protein
MQYVAEGYHGEKLRGQREPQLSDIAKIAKIANIANIGNPEDESRSG